MITAEEIIGSAATRYGALDQKGFNRYIDGIYSGVRTLCLDIFEDWYSTYCLPLTFNQQGKKALQNALEDFKYAYVQQSDRGYIIELFRRYEENQGEDATRDLLEWIHNATNYDAYSTWNGLSEGRLCVRRNEASSPPPAVLERVFSIYDFYISSAFEDKFPSELGPSFFKSEWDRLFLKKQYYDYYGEMECTFDPSSEAMIFYCHSRPESVLPYRCAIWMSSCAKVNDRHLVTALLSGRAMSGNPVTALFSVRGYYDDCINSRGWGDMLKRVGLLIRKFLHVSVRKLISWLPREQRFKVFRSFADCNPAPSSRLQLKIAETKEELEACFAVLHDAYVDSGFMKPDPSGMRVTIYHALPTTTTLCAKYDGEVVGTISLIRESALGVPLQKIFDLNSVREKEGLDRRGVRTHLQHLREDLGRTGDDVAGLQVGSSPPERSLTRPPASEISRLPAAMSQGDRPNSQKPSKRPQAT
jgi:hypothetical protein